MSLINIQKKIGTVPDGVFGPNTARAIAGFLKLNNVEAAHFLGQCSHETSGWRLFEENLAYSREALLRVFPKYFNESNVDLFAGNPIEIANKVYGGRMGNKLPNDGWKFRGRGPIQTTGRYNYTELANHLNMPEIIDVPDLVKTAVPLESSVFFFEKNGLFDLAKDVTEETIQKISKRVNGGHNGLKDRQEWTLKIYSWITI